MVTLLDMLDQQDPEKRRKMAWEKALQDLGTAGHPMSISPLGILYRTYRDGPGALQSMWETIKMPGDIAAGKKPATVEDAAKFALDVGLMSAPIGTPKGALRTFGGPAAKTADHTALKLAKSMAKKGATREAIWDKTGWFKGVDGKWRFEINDKAAYSDIPAAVAERKEMAAWVADDAELAAMVKSRAEKRGISVENAAKSLSEELKKPIPRNAMDMANSGKTAEELVAIAREPVADPYATPFRMDHVFGHDDLYKAYPETAGRPLHVGKDLPLGYKAAYEPAKDRFFIQKYLENDPDFALGHEVQHRIQGTERFATGGNAGTMVYDRLKPVTERLETLQKAGAYDGFDAFRNGPARLNKSFDTHNKMVDAYLREHPEDELFREVRRLEVEKGNLLEEGQKAYNRLAGEVEARNVQARRNMTAEERRATPPWLTQDTPDADQIVRFGGDDLEREKAGILRYLLGK